MLIHEIVFWIETKKQNIKSSTDLINKLRDDNFLQSQDGKNLLSALDKSLDNYAKFLDLPGSYETTNPGNGNKA